MTREDDDEFEVEVEGEGEETETEDGCDLDLDLDLDEGEGEGEGEETETEDGCDLDLDDLEKCVKRLCKPVCFSCLERDEGDLTPHRIGLRDVLNSTVCVLRDYASNLETLVSCVDSGLLQEDVSLFTAERVERFVEACKEDVLLALSESD